MEIEPDNITSVHRSSCKVGIARVFVRFQVNVNFWKDFQNLLKIPVQ